MSLTVEKKNLIVITGTGLISKDEFITAYDEAISLPEFSAGDPLLFDLKDATLQDLSFQDCSDIAKHEDIRRQERGAGRCALVVSDNSDFGVSRIIQAFRDYQFEEAQVSVFKDMDTAVYWLNGTRQL